MKKFLLILLCLPMIGFGQKPCEEKKCSRCLVNVNTCVYFLQNEISDILEGNYELYQLNIEFYFPKVKGTFNRVDAVEFYLKHKVTNEKSKILKYQVDAQQKKYSGLRILQTSPYIDVLDQMYTKSSESNVEIYFRSFCYNSKYYSDWFSQDLQLSFIRAPSNISFANTYQWSDANGTICGATSSTYSDIEEILKNYLTNDVLDIEIHDYNFDVRSYFYDTTFIKSEHTTYSTAPESGFNPIATIESKSRQEDLLKILKDIGLDVIYRKETRRTPVHNNPIYTTPTYTTPTYTEPSTHIQVSPGIVKSYPGKTTGGVTYGGVTYGGGTSGGLEYDVYTYILIEKKKKESNIKESKYDILLKLNELKEKGILSEAEFIIEKKKLLKSED